MSKTFSKSFSISMFDRNSISEIMMKEPVEGAAVIGVWHSMATLAFADADGCVRLTPTIAMNENAIAEYFRMPINLVCKAIGWLKRLNKLIVENGYLKFNIGSRIKRTVSPERQEYLNMLNRQRVSRCREKQRKEKVANTEDCNGCNAPVMVDVMEPVMQPVMDILEKDAKITKTPMVTRTKPLNPNACNTPVMDAVAKEKRKNQRKENNNYSISSLASWSETNCEDKETAVMPHEEIKELHETAASEAEPVQAHAVSFAQDDRTETLPLEKETSPLRRIIDSWNRLHLKPYSGKIPGLMGKISALLSQYTLETITKTIDSIAACPFLLGKKENSRWVITFEWLLNPGNFAKVLAGKYHDKPRNYSENTNSLNCGELWQPGTHLPFCLPGECANGLRPVVTETGFDALFQPITQQQKEAARLLGMA